MNINIYFINANMPYGLVDQFIFDITNAVEILSITSSKRSAV